MCASGENKIFSEQQPPRHSFPCESVPNIERHCAWAGAGEERSNLEGRIGDSSSDLERPVGVEGLELTTDW